MGPLVFRRTGRDPRIPGLKSETWAGRARAGSSQRRGGLQNLLAIVRRLHCRHQCRVFPLVFREMWGTAGLALKLVAGPNKEHASVSAHVRWCEH
jgi:hypothetical protein